MYPVMCLREGFLYFKSTSIDTMFFSWWTKQRDLVHLTFPLVVGCIVIIALSQYIIHTIQLYCDCVLIKLFCTTALLPVLSFVALHTPFLDGRSFFFRLGD